LFYQWAIYVCMCRSAVLS